ncbi:hypothetical protein CRN84_19505 [Budvicia aquatica]|uniref:Uncharacterized protein n=1 Tax=Budvicia aquatica TaxID=82979 RepID=A0A2C6C4U3_9GAMM|nr:hypothetical protein CRN84_19505 [Budvicia aquatica]
MKCPEILLEMIKKIQDQLLKIRGEKTKVYFQSFEQWGIYMVITRVLHKSIGYLPQNINKEIMVSIEI